MIKSSSDYTGSTEQQLSGSHPPSKVNRVASNHAAECHDQEDYSLSFSQEDFMTTESQKIHSWLKPGYDCLISRTISTSRSPNSSCDTEAAKVLVVDDHTASRMTTVALLAMEGYTVIEGDSGVVAVELVKRQQPDLILLDVMMPGMDGFEVCQLLKQDENTRLIPIIFITALNDRRSRIRGIEAGADDFLTKPFDRVELVARLILPMPRRQGILEESTNELSMVLSKTPY